MRTSAHSIKANGSQIQDKPREGSIIRGVYDKAITGEWFDLIGVEAKNRTSVLEALRSSYELEFISRSHPNRQPHQRALRQFKCVGMWHGADLRSLEDVQVALEHTTKGTL